MLTVEERDQQVVDDISRRLSDMYKSLDVDRTYRADRTDKDYYKEILYKVQQALPNVTYHAVCDETNNPPTIMDSKRIGISVYFEVNNKRYRWATCLY